MTTHRALASTRRPFTTFRLGGAVAPLVVGVAALVVLGFVPACTKREAARAPTPSSTTPVGDAPLRVLVTNDDGYAAAGIDAVVEALRKEPNVDVRVSAPLENQSGTGGKTTDGPLTATDVTTASGHPAKAVRGFPADSVKWALDGGIGFQPDLVVSGNNEGPNLGPIVDLSGTVGAARAAAKRGIPAVAISQGLGTPPDYDSGVKVLVEWFRANRKALPAPSVVVSFNVPTCAGGQVRGVVEVPAATDLAGRDPFGSDCTTTAGAPSDDVDAFNRGYVARSNVPLGS